ncbi:hypothetical protein HKX48_008852 [Thoreauomyces humboldtii]|nr:hypothetical protein HKX48_008852 [Thoreauomyces humboldtii]
MAGASQWEEREAYRPSHNVGPTRMQPVLRRSASPDGTTTTTLRSMKWGVVPSWSKQIPNFKNALQTINARDDRIRGQAKSMWAGLKHKHRCVVIAEGFFEWLKKGKERQPYYIRREDKQLLMFAGLWDRAVVEASSKLSFLHERMPVILNDEKDVDLWLSPHLHFTEEVSQLMRPTEDGLEWFTVSTLVNKVGAGHDKPECIVPVKITAEGGKGSITSYFGKATPSTTGTSTKSEKIAGSMIADGKKDSEVSAVAEERKISAHRDEVVDKPTKRKMDEEEVIKGEAEGGHCKKLKN